MQFFQWQSLTNATIKKEVNSMAEYGIMRIEKRTRPAVYGLQIEANRQEADQYKRDFFNSDIDWTRTKNNIFIKKTENWNREITRQIKDAGVKERKDSIVLLDGLYTCSPEWFETHSKKEIVQYFKDCISFHIKEYCGGDKSRLINAVLHLDEKTIHLHIASTCIYQDEKGMHLSAKNIMGGRDDYRLRQDRFFNEVSSRYGMERGEPKDPAEVKRHTTKREWQVAKQEQELNILEDKKAILEFDLQSIQCRKNYECQKAEEAERKRQDIQNEINKLESTNNELIQKNEELYNSRYEQFKKYKQGMELKKRMETEIEELSKQENNLKEYLIRNAEIIRNWKNEVESKINAINNVMEEYEAFSSDAEKRYSKEVEEYILNALGDIPEDGPEIDFNTPTPGFTSYSEEEYDLER